MSSILSLKKYIRHQSYTIAFKRVAIKHYEKTNNNRQSASNLKISRACLFDWVKNKDIIFSKDVRLNSRRIVHVNEEEKRKKAFFYDNEQRVYTWFLEQRSNNHKVTPLDIKTRMLDDLKEKGNTSTSNDPSSFIASNGWFQRFIRR